MTEKTEERIESFFEDSFIACMPFRTTVRLKKVRESGADKIKVFFEEDEIKTSKLVGTYFNAKWHFDFPMHESMFWKMVKNPKYTNKFRKMFNRLRIRETGTESAGARMYFYSLIENIKRRKKIRIERKKSNTVTKDVGNI